MRHYDWIQWYLLANIILGVVLVAWKNGEPKSNPNHSIDTHFACLLFAAPWIGRVFGWW